MSFTTAHEVEIESDSLLLETGNKIKVRWTPESILPQFPPDDYTVDIRLYTVDPLTEVWREVYVLASDIQNNGTIDVTFPDVGGIINPRRACAARVTVVGLCVCVCVCLSVCLLLNISL